MRLDNNGSSDRLQASWLSPEGGVDFYLLTLSAQDSAQKRLRLTPNVTAVVFQDLMPGRSYQLRISSVAGNSSSETRINARTGR